MSQEAARTTDRQRQTRHAFAPSDVKSLLSVPEIEAKYRLLRNEWLTLHSRYKQADEWVLQAERTGGPTEISEARALRARISTDLGTYRRITLLARVRAEAEIYMELAQRLLPADIRIILEGALKDVLHRDNREISRDDQTRAAPNIDDYKLLDNILARWTLKPDASDEEADR